MEILAPLLDRSPLLWLGDALYVGAFGLLLLGVFIMVNSRHLIRIILGLSLLEAGVNLFLVAVGYRPDAQAPILVAGKVAPMVDPIPQALVLTAIVIGVGVLALALALAVRVHEAYGTLDLGLVGGEESRSSLPTVAGSRSAAPRQGRATIEPGGSAGAQAGQRP